MQTISIAIRPMSCLRKWILVEPVQINIFQSNTNRIDLSWLDFDNELSIQKSQQVNGQQ